MRIAVVGAGASATAVVVRQARSNQELEVFCFDRYPLGRSLAFCRTSTMGTCNTSDDANAPFVRSLIGNSPSANASTFRARSDIGNALHSAVQELKNRPSIRIHELLGDVARIDRQDQTLTVTTGNGSQVDRLERVFLCRGLTTAHVPHQYRHLTHLASVYSSPYPLHETVEVLRGKRVLVVGASLSAIETAVELSEHDAHVTIASRSEGLPSVRRALPVHAGAEREWAEHILSEAPLNAQEMTKTILRFAVTQELHFPEEPDPSQDARGTLLSEIDNTSKESHWSETIIPICRAVNKLPHYVTQARDALEGPRLRRFTNAVTLDAAARLYDGLTDRRIRLSPLQEISYSTGQISQFEMQTKDGWKNFDAVVLACGWRRPQPIPGADRCPTARASDHPQLTRGCVSAVGVEAFDLTAVPNALFALEDHLSENQPMPHLSQT